MKVKRFLLAVLTTILMLSIVLPASLLASTTYEQTEHNSWIVVSAGAYNRVGQYINITDSWIYSVQFYVKRIGTCGGQTPYARIRSSTDDSILGEVDMGVWDTWSLTGEWRTATFASPVHVTGWVYISFESTWAIGGTSQPYVAFQNNSVLSEQEYGQYAYPDGGWINNSNKELAYKFTIDEAPNSLNVGSDCFTYLGSDNGSLRGHIYIASSNATIRGFEWGNSTGNYTSNVTEAGSFGVGYYSLNIDGLVQGEWYYWRAIAYNEFAGWTYGSQLVFQQLALPEVTTDTAISSIVNGHVVATFSGTIADNSTQADLRGFQIGTSTGNYNLQYYLNQIATSDNSTGWTGTNGSFALNSLALSANTTYYYRAFARVYNGQNNAELYGYGIEKSFTTVSYSGLLVPVVQIVGASILTIPVTSLQVTIHVLSSPSAPLSEIGLRWGKIFPFSADNITWMSEGYRSYTALGTHIWKEQMISANLYWGDTIYLQAFAIDTLNNKGESNVYTVIFPRLSTGAGGLTVTNSGAIVNGNTASVSAIIVNPANIPLDRWMVAWGTSYISQIPFGVDKVEAIGEVQVPITGTNPTTLNYVITGLEETLIYYYQFAVHDNQDEWVFSQPTSFTTGSVIPFPIAGKPAVETLTATNIGVNYFTANGNLISKGDATVTQLGFAWSITTTSDVSTWQTNLTSGSWTSVPQAFSKIISVSQNSIKLYYSAVAVNMYGTSYGSIYYVELSGYKGGGGEGGGTGGAGGAGGGFPALIDAIARTQHMEGLSGRWLVLVEFMVLTSLLFVFLTVQTDEEKRAIVLVIWAIVEMCIVGAFVFTLTLGIIPIVILASATVLIIFIIGGRVLVARGG